MGETLTKELQNQDSQLLKKLVDFVSGENIITDITYGCSPEESKQKVVYFIGEAPVDEALEDRITNLDLEIANTTDYVFDIMRWPIKREQISQYSFLGDVIYQKEITQKN